MQSFASLALVLLLLAGCASRVLVTRVVDGDTIELESGEIVRYLGIDTPESVHPRKPVEFWSHEATEANRELVLGKKVRLAYDVERRDRYGRTLAFVYADKTFVNLELVRKGYAKVLTIKPNVEHSQEFKDAEAMAKGEGIGMWDEKAKEEWERENKKD